MHLLPGSEILLAGIGTDQIPQNRHSCFLRQGICKGIGFCGDVSFQRVCQHIHARVRHHGFGNTFYKAGIQDRRIRKKRLVHQGIFDSLFPVCDHGKGCDFRAGSAGGGNRNKFHIRQVSDLSGKMHDGLGLINGRPSAQGNEGIRSVFYHLFDTFDHQFQGRVRNHIAEDRTAVFFQISDDTLHKAGLHHKRICDNKYPGTLQFF